MNRVDYLSKHIQNSKLLEDGSGKLVNPITADMFKLSDITEVHGKIIPNNISLPSHSPDRKIIFVKFRGINGTIPIRFFDPKAQNKIYKWVKIHNSPLYEVLNE